MSYLYNLFRVFYHIFFLRSTFRGRIGHNGVSAERGRSSRAGGTKTDTSQLVGAPLSAPAFLAAGQRLSNARPSAAVAQLSGLLPQHL